MNPVIPVLAAIFLIVELIVFRKSIAEWFHNLHWHLMGFICNECPRCHRRYLHERDMKSCRCRPGVEDDRGIGVKAPRGKFDGPSAWPPGL